MVSLVLWHLIGLAQTVSELHQSEAFPAQASFLLPFLSQASLLHCNLWLSHLLLLLLCILPRYFLLVSLLHFLLHLDICFPEDPNRHFHLSGPNSQSLFFMKTLGLFGQELILKKARS